jgi:16S rRNA G966 N2-methylase RsmD
MGDQSDLAKDEAAIQKRFWDIAISEKYRFKHGLDLFGGVGFSGFIWSQCCDHVTIVEEDEKAFELLKQNLSGLTNITLINEKNLKFLESCQEEYDLIDFDPFDNANAQLAYLEKIFKSGVVCITSGEIMTVSRNLPHVADYIKPTKAEYIGKKAWKWAEDIFIPHIRWAYRLEPVTFYTYPSSVRAIFTRGMEVDASIFEGDRYLGWFRDKS